MAIDYLSWAPSHTGNFSQEVRLSSNMFYSAVILFSCIVSLTGSAIHLTVLLDI